MKVSFSLTLDGLVRALRTRLHHAQDDMSLQTRAAKRWQGKGQEETRDASRLG